MYTHIQYNDNGKLQVKARDLNNYTHSYSPKCMYYYQKVTLLTCIRHAQGDIKCWYQVIHN